VPCVPRPNSVRRPSRKIFRFLDCLDFLEMNMNISDIINSLKRCPQAITDADESIYALVASEVAMKRMRPGVYAKAFADACGDQNKATALYITYRAAQVRQDISAAIQESMRGGDDTVNASTTAELSRAAQLVSMDPQERERLRKKYAELDAEDDRIAQHERRVGRRK
jgi:hypothetical protein